MQEDQKASKYAGTIILIAKYQWCRGQMAKRMWERGIFAYDHVAPRCGSIKMNRICYPDKIKGRGDPGWRSIAVLHGVCNDIPEVAPLTLQQPVCSQQFLHTQSPSGGSVDHCCSSPITALHKCKIYVLELTELLLSQLRHLLAKHQCMVTRKIWLLFDMVHLRMLDQLL